ncbi:MAG: hypothetical protein NTU44_16495 [Bacteroidetes bacterium]|nr:hypothetical protein [Bacteroidota bacterium]
MKFEPGKDENGNYKTGTYEIGIIDRVGNEIKMISRTTNEPGSISTDFNLKNGEMIYTKEPTGNSRISATKKLPTDNNNP